jgi:enamine deaminase RidA (YjgF/YER057c/UK114 family)
MKSTSIVLVTLALAGSSLAGCSKPDQKNGDTTVKGTVQHLNPDGLHKNPAYSQAVVVTGNVKTVYVGGQNAVDVSGKIVGKGDIKAQTNRCSRTWKPPWRQAGRSWSTSSSGM